MIVDTLTLLKSKLSLKLNSSDKRAKIQDSDFVIAVTQAVAVAKNNFSLASLRLSVISFSGIKIGSSAFNERLGTISLVNHLKMTLKVLLSFSSAINSDGAAALLAKKLKVTEIIGTDASLVTLWNGLSEHFAGTFMESAMKLHITCNLVTGAVEWFDMTKGSTHDSQRFSEVKPGSLYIFDLGYWCLSFLQKIADKKAFFLSRVRKDAKFTISRVISGFGQSHVGSDLLSIPIFKKRNSIIEVFATSLIDGIEQEFRILGFWSQKNRVYHWYVTNLDAPRGIIRELYRLRWQLELSFKALKSTLNFDQMPTLNPNAVISFSLIALINYMFSVILRLESEKIARDSSNVKLKSSSIQKAAKVFREVARDLLEGLKIGRRMTTSWVQNLQKKLKLLLDYISDPNLKIRKNTIHSLLSYEK